jgi:hypothetical protein
MTDNELRESYTFLHLSSVIVYKSAVPHYLNGKLGDRQDIPGVLELPDETWELIVHRLYVTKLCSKLRALFPLCQVNPDYDPTEPTAADIQRFRYDVAKWQKESAFFAREQSMRDAWPTAAKYYNLRAEDIRVERSYRGGESLSIVPLMCHTTPLSTGDNVGHWPLSSSSSSLSPRITVPQLQISPDSTISAPQIAISTDGEWVNSGIYEDGNQGDPIALFYGDEIDTRTEIAPDDDIRAMIINSSAHLLWPPTPPRTPSPISDVDIEDVGEYVLQFRNNLAIENRERVERWGEEGRLVERRPARRLIR